jgi:hypothetical protein
VKCETVNKLLDNFVIRRLPESEANEVSHHLSLCNDCQQTYLYTRALVDALQGLTVPAVSTDFADRVISKAVRTGGYQPVRLLSYVASGIAASFAILFVLAFTMLESPSNISSSPVVLIGDEIKTVKLAIESARTVEGIKMTIDLSDNLQISGYENQQSISWGTRLEKGTNVIALPISAIARGNGEIKARVEFKGNEKVFIFDTRYESSDPGKAQYLTTEIIKT